MELLLERPTARPVAENPSVFDMSAAVTLYRTNTK
jgi:hypothetical protein